MVLLVWVEVVGMLVVGRTLGVVVVLVVVVVLSGGDEAVLIGVTVKKVDVGVATWKDALVFVKHAVELVVLPLSTDPVV